MPPRWRIDPVRIPTLAARPRLGPRAIDTPRAMPVAVNDIIELPLHGRIAAGPERAVFVVDIGDAAGHPGGEVAARHAQNHHRAAGHVLASMVAHTFDDGLAA